MVKKGKPDDFFMSQPKRKRKFLKEMSLEEY